MHLMIDGMEAPISSECRFASASLHTQQTGRMVRYHGLFGQGGRISQRYCAVLWMWLLRKSSSLDQSLPATWSGDHNKVVVGLMDGDEARELQTSTLENESDSLALVKA